MRDVIVAHRRLREGGSLSIYRECPIGPLRELSSRTSEASVGIHYLYPIACSKHVTLDPDTRSLRSLLRDDNTSASLPPFFPHFRINSSTAFLACSGDTVLKSTGHCAALASTSRIGQRVIPLAFASSIIRRSSGE
jgi:hypothetical protein